MRDFSAAAALALSAAVLACGGCCTVAAFFCGPDRSPWVPHDYRTPESALATLLEAIRRDQPVVIYTALSEGAKARYGLAGVDVATIAWERLKERVSGLHLAGRAIPSPRQSEPDGRMKFDLALAGRSLTVRLVEQTFWELWYLGEDGDVESAGRYVDAKTFAKMVFWRDGAEPGVEEPGIDVRVTDLLLPELSAARVRELRVGRAWKVDEFEGFAPDS